MLPHLPRTAPFFLAAFAITWGLQVPGVLAVLGLIPGDPATYLPLAGLGISGPLIAATALTASESGAAGVRALYAPLLRWRASWRIYVIALVLPGALLTGLLLLLGAAGRQGPIAYLPALGALPAALFISVAEEVGWRGYALPRLQARWGAFAASVFLGVLWYLWHIPMFVGLGVPLELVLVMLLFFTGSSLLMTWVHNRSGQSLLLAALAHLGAHLNNSHRALPEEVLPLVAHAIVYAALGLWLMRRTLPALGRGSSASSPHTRAESSAGERSAGTISKLTAVEVVSGGV